MPANSDHNQQKSRPLICFIGTLRSLEITADSLIKHLIEPLNADVAFCVSRISDQDENKIQALAPARIVDRCIYEDADLGYEYLCDTLSTAMGLKPPFPWRKLLTIEGNWLGGVAGIPGSGMHLNYNLFKLSQRLRSPAIQAQNYSHFIITRTDFQWLAPHPPLRLMNTRLAWIPEGEDYHGYNDRHMVCSNANVFKCLDLFDAMISGEAHSYLGPYKSLNHEYQTKLHLVHRGLRVGRFKNLAYLTGGAQTQTNWSGLKLKQIDGITYNCKYPGEVDSATANSKAFAEHNNPDLLIIEPKPLQSRIPIWKSRLRRAYPALTKLLRSAGSETEETSTAKAASHSSTQSNHPTQP